MFHVKQWGIRFNRCWVLYKKRSVFHVKREKGNVGSVSRETITPRCAVLLAGDEQ